MRLFSDLSRYDWTALVLTFVGSGTPGLLTLILTTENNINAGTIALAAITPTATTTAVLVSLVAGNRKRNVEERDKRRRLAQSLIEDYLAIVVKDLSKRPEATGATVYFPGDDGRLHPTYLYNKKGKSDENLAFAPLEGCTGHAWSREIQTWADLEHTTDQDLEMTWKLTPEMAKLTEHLTSVVSTPIFSSDHTRKLAVLTLDCEAPNNASYILSDETLDRAPQHARLLSSVLEVSNLV